MESNLLELVNTINQVKLGNQFHKYIDFIRYPFYRNIEIDTQINFGFPLMTIPANVYNDSGV